MSQRKKLQLAKEAIPTIFPNVLPRISNEKTKNRIPSAHTYPLENDDTVSKVEYCTQIH